MAGDGVVLRSEFNASDVLDAHDSTIRRSADNNLFKLLRRDQPALRPNRVRKFLTLGCGLAANLAGWIYRILRLERCYDLGHSDREFGQLIRLHPQSHRVSAGS